MMASAISDDMIRRFYHAKRDLILQLESSWKAVSDADLPNIAPRLPEADRLIRTLDELDEQYRKTFGLEPFEAALKTFHDSQDGAAERKRLQERIDSALQTFERARIRIQDLKDGVGKRLSDMRSRRNISSKHGQFDRRG